MLISRMTRQCFLIWNDVRSAKRWQIRFASINQPQHCLAGRKTRKMHKNAGKKREKQKDQQIYSTYPLHERFNIQIATEDAVTTMR